MKLIAIIILCTLFASGCIIKISNVLTGKVYKEDFNKFINIFLNINQNHLILLIKMLHNT